MQSLLVYAAAAVLVAAAPPAPSTLFATISDVQAGYFAPDFFGISSNWINFPGYCGNNSASFPGQPWFIPLLSNLRPCVQFHGPSIRINADGQAPFWGPAWPKKPQEWGSNPDYNVTEGADALARTLQTLNGTFIVGLPFQVYAAQNGSQPWNPILAVQMAQGTTSVVNGRVPMLFEIGNEPDWDAVRFDFYDGENGWEPFWRTYADAILATGVVQPKQIVGGVWASCSWCGNASHFVATKAPSWAS